MKRKLMSLFAVAAAFALALALAGCGGQSSSGASSAAGTESASASQAAASADVPTVKIAYLPITHALPTFEEAELLKEQDDPAFNLELVKYGSWPELMDALNSGQVQGASVLVELGMRSAEQGIGVKAVALGHRDGNVIVGSNDVAATSDLKGKTIAIPARQSSHFILVNDALEKAGLALDDVEITELAPTEMPSALASGQIDAYCVAEPFGAKGVDLGAGHVLENSEDLWEDSLCCALVLTDQFIDASPDTAKVLVAQYKQAGAQLADKELAKQVAEQYLDSTDEVLETSLEWIKYDNLEITEDTYNTLVEKVKRYGLSENPPAYEEFVVNLG